MKSSFVLLSLFSVAGAQAVNITGSVNDSMTSRAISNALVKIVELPQCSARTDAGGAFTLLNGSVSALGGPLHQVRGNPEISLRNNELLISNAAPSSRVLVRVFNSRGECVGLARYMAGPGGMLSTDLPRSPGWRCIRIGTDGKDFTIAGMGTTGCFSLSAKAGAMRIHNADDRNSLLGKSAAAYTIVVSAPGYSEKQAAIAGATGSVGTIGLLRPQQGAGTHCTPNYLDDVTGAGPMPDISNGYTCNCDGTGATDVTSCLQTAANTAHSQNKPLLIPYTSGYYKISSVLNIQGSVIGMGAGMPTIRQTNSCGSAECAGLRLAANMSGWIYNLHIVGTYTGTVTSEFAHNISIGGVNGVTVMCNVLENAMGDNITDNAQEMDGASAARNVLISNNTLTMPRRCNVSLNNVSDRWAIINNDMIYAARYVDPIDVEPWRPVSHITNIEVGYNRITSTGAASEYYGVIMDCDDWFDKTPGGNIYGHHNYGSWSVPFSQYSSTWTNVVFTRNVEGDSVPQQALSIPAISPNDATSFPGGSMKAGGIFVRLAICASISFAQSVPAP